VAQLRARTVTDLEYELREARHRLAQGERALRTARTRLEVFAARYQRTVGERFEHLRRLQSVSGGAVGSETLPAPRAPRPERPPGNAEFDRLYRELARRVHPDVSHDPGERAMRTRAMAELNAARETLDFDRARRLGDTFDGRVDESEPDSEDSEDQFERLLVAIERVEARLTAVTADAVRLRENKLYLLMEVVEAQERAGIDVLGETAADLDGQIAEARAAIAIGREPAAAALPEPAPAPASGSSAEPLDLDLARGSSFWTARFAAALAIAGGIALVAASLAATAPSQAMIVTAPTASVRATQTAAVETTPAPHAYLAVEREQSATGRTTATVRIVIEGALTPAEKMSTLAEAARRELRSQQALVVFAYSSIDEIGGPFTIGRAYLSVDGKGWSGDGQTPDGPDSGGVVGSVVVTQGATTETRIFSAPR
jgi:hypothetical protein